MTKTRINIYIDSGLAERFKRLCHSRRKSYSELLEPLIYKAMLNTPASSESANLKSIQEEIHEEAVQAFHEVYNSRRQDVIDASLENNVSNTDLSKGPSIPIPPLPEVTNGKPNHLSKRNKRR